MDQLSATQFETLQPPDEVWRRFTLLDLMILFTGHGAAMGIWKWNGALESVFSETLVGIFLLILAVLMLGAGISIPLIYLIQFFSRHRRKRLSYGEILGVINILFWGAIYFKLLNFLPTALGFLLIGCILVACFAGAIIFFAKLISIRTRNAPCRWLDLYGHFLGIVSVGIAVLWIIWLRLSFKSGVLM
jgi:hypothetical protein